MKDESSPQDEAVLPPASIPPPSSLLSSFRVRAREQLPDGPATRNRRSGRGLSHARNGVPAMSSKKQVFTTGQVAKICQVAPRTVSKWFDSGKLRGYRIPGSQDRRIPREQLIRFLKEYGMPLGDLEEQELHKILLIGSEKLFNDRMKELLPEAEDYKYELASSGFQAGSLAHSFNPDSIVIDLSLGR